MYTNELYEPSKGEKHYEKINLIYNLTDENGESF